MSNWQPMGTAPRDGSVIVVRNRSEDRILYDYALVVWDELEDEYWLRHDDFDVFDDFVPSEWMSLGDHT